MISRVSKSHRLKLTLHHIWSSVLLFLAVMIVSLAVGLTLVKASTPLLAHHHENIQNWLSKRLKHPLQIGELKAGWHGFEPIIEIDNVTIENKKHQKIAKFKHFSIGFNLLKTVLTQKLRIGFADLSGVNIFIKQQKNHITQVYIDSKTPFLTIKPQKHSSSNLIDDLFEVNTISLSHINLSIENSNHKSISLKNLHLKLYNPNIQQHQIFGGALFNTPNHAGLSLMAQINGLINQPHQLSGNLYLQTENLPLVNLLNFFLPAKFQVQSGLYNGQIWGKIEKGKLTAIQSKNHLKNLSILNLATQKNLKIPSLDLALDYKKNQAAGWRILTKIQENLNQKLQAINLEINHNANNQYTLYSSAFQLKNIQKFIDFYAPKTVTNFLTQNHFDAKINHLFVEYQSKNHYEAHALYSHLSFNNKLKNIQIGSLDGSIFIYPKMGSVQINGKNLNINDTLLVNPNVHLKKFINTIYWYKNNSSYTVSWPKINVTSKKFNVSGYIHALIPSKANKAAQATVINSQLNIQHLNMADIQSLMPANPAQHLHLFEFLKRAFSEGEANACINLAGTPSHLNINGKLNFKNTSLLFKPGWPRLENLKGHLHFMKNKLEIMASTGEIFNAKLKNITAVIPDVNNKKNPSIFVKGQVFSTLENAKAFINATELRKKLGKKLKDLKFTGPMDLTLSLMAPLKDHTFHTKASGSIELHNDSVALPNLKLNFTNLSGLFHFEPDGIEAKAIRGSFYGQPLLLNIKNFPKDHCTQFNFWSSITGATIHKRIKNAFSNALSGATQFHGLLKLYDAKSNKMNQLTINSSLKGFISELPTPFNKTVKQNFPVNITLKYKDAQPMTLYVNLDHKAQFLGVFNKLNRQTSLSKGILTIGKSNLALPQSKGLMIKGHLKYMNWVKWKPFITSSKKQHKENKSIVSKVDLSIGQFKFYHFLFVRNHLQMQQYHKQWQLEVNGPEIAGVIRLPSPSDTQISANLSRLYLNSNKSNIDHPESLNPQDLPALSVNIKDFRIGSNVYGHAQLITQKNQQGIRIKLLALEDSLYQLKSYGDWEMVGNTAHSELKGSLKTQSLSYLLKLFSIKSNLSAENLSASFNLSWPNSLLDPKIKSLQGTVALSSGEGVLKNIGTKASNELATGELLTFLSLKSLQKRLFLNFNDLNSKGFHFEEIKGRFHLENGVASTENTKIKGIVASIAISGELGLVKKDFNLVTRVTPHVTSSLPIIATLAGGPLVGAVTYVINKLLTPSLNTMTTRIFRITGSWKNPKIEQINQLSVKNKSMQRFQYI